ncbi:site-specific DNA-methyltransferase [Sphingopyxis sp.]|uniref:DNA-methyltransferase n=1 Tax=Sphingopyxis sp. TaxID=1908224 RepID=UPI0025F2C0F3|nr:site-specific DNA-methyltransferase [Sphingopyxis sp.]
MAGCPAVLCGDCREIAAAHGPYDLIIAGPPYCITTLCWDRRVEGRHALAAALLKPVGSLWVFGSLRYLLADAGRFEAVGLRYAQDIVWRKANGTGFAADRFKRVHEIIVQYYRHDALWRDVYNDVQRVPATTRNKSVQLRRARTKHTGSIGAGAYHDDGTRIMKSVIEINSVRSGLHRTEKPVALLAILMRTSCPTGGLVGDFFAGSGAAGEAAALTGRRYVGCEVDPLMAAKARARLNALHNRPS